MAGAFLISACVIFSLKYALPGTVLPLFFDSGESANRMYFFLNFYISLFISALCLYSCLFAANFFIRGAVYIAGLCSAVIACYVLNDLLTINLCIYSAYVLTSAAAFSPPKNFIITAFALFFFAVFLFHPAFLGPVGSIDRFFIPSYEDFIILLLNLVILSAALAAMSYIAEKLSSTEATVTHLNAVGAKMLLFNHRLQEYVKNSGEEIVKKDRLRFTSELHDSCGYVFTNIIAVTEAAMSFSRMKPEKARNTLQIIRDQAQQGLHRTRETLHMIRELQDPASGSIDTVYEMKTIFQEVTGIQVDIESGNMKHDYGPTINTVLTRIVQEAFTNSIRHGQASRILINFWEFPECLTMTVSDNGIGARHIVKGIGLAGMEERLAAVGGAMEVFSPEDGGFRLKVTIPLVEMALPVSIADQKEAAWE